MPKTSLTGAFADYNIWDPIDMDANDLFLGIPELNIVNIPLNSFVGNRIRRVCRSVKRKSVKNPGS